MLNVSVLLFGDGVGLREFHWTLEVGWTFSIRGM